MNIPNLGQGMFLGDLYNVRTGQHTNESVLSATLPPTLIESRDENAINTKFISEDSYKEKFKAFEIDGDLKLNILANIVALNAHAKYLATEKQSSKSVKVSMTYAVQTKLEKINIRSDKIREYISLKALKNTDATHVVTGIQWGANMLCSFEHSLEEGESKKEVAYILGTSCNTLKAGAGIDGGLTKSSGKSNVDLSVRISILGDIIPTTYPTSVEDAVQLLRRVPEFVAGANQGKGSVLEYKLEPIEKVRSQFDLETKIESTIKNVHLDLVDKVESTFDTIVENRIRLNEATNDILEYGQYISKTEVKRIKEELKSFSRDEKKFKNSLSKTVRAIQAEKESVDELFQLLEDFEEGSCSSSMVDEIIESHQSLTRWISFIRRCEKIKIQVISRVDDVSNILSTSATAKTFIIIIPESSDYTMTEQSHLWHIFRLLREDNNHAQTAFMIHDVSISPKVPQFNDLTELTIVKYHGSIKSNQDAFRASILSPSIKLSLTESMNQTERAKLAGHALVMPCPSSHEGECHSGALEWVCCKCEEVMQYEYNEVVYCRCGKTSLKDCTFRCDSIEHGYQYKELHAQSTQSITEKIRPRDDEINVPLLGVKNHGSNKSDEDAFRTSILRPSIKLSLTEAVTREERTKLAGHTLRMPCPSSREGECHSGALKWVCFKCEEVMQYEYNELVYCRCGKTRLKDCTFRCDSIEHGYQYKELHAQSIQSISEKIRPGDDEINILLLGETGVGKSTFINAFANYLRYDSLEIAERMEMTTLTQSKFEIQGTTVIAGKPDQNEKLRNGQSSTQYCRSYVFPLNDDIKIRLIDTPEIGDTRGVKQDRVNFEEILNYISGFDKIHGICILLLPDTPRLTTSFRFCIDELLSHLHKSATDNILFTFTMTRSSFYEPGDTMTPLRTYMKELELANGISIQLQPNTLFYFDNEAFRFYTALKQGFVFDPKTKEAFGASWTKSVEEARRLVKRVMELTPHKTAETVTLNMVRRSIILLAPLMAKISENITIEVESIKNLRARRNYLYVDMISVNLERPSLEDTSKWGFAYTQAERIKTLESEKKIIFGSLMTFMVFLLQNYILVQDCGIVAYLDMNIENQDKIAQRTKDFSIVRSLQAQKNEFVAQMEIIERAIKHGESHVAKITASDVFSAREELCRLEVNGQAMVNALDWGQ